MQMQNTKMLKLKKTKMVEKRKQIECHLAMACAQIKYANIGRSLSVSFSSSLLFNVFNINK